MPTLSVPGSTGAASAADAALSCDASACAGAAYWEAVHCVEPVEPKAAVMTAIIPASNAAKNLFFIFPSICF